MGPLLETKFHFPRGPETPIIRSRVSDLLGRRGGAAVVVVSAPAGSGKTTAVVEWIASLPADGSVVAWLSLDERDKDPVTFWTYVIAAFQRALDDRVGAASSLLLDSSRAPIDTVVTTLLNELMAAGARGDFTGDVVLVLDDYHVITAPEIHQSVASLVERLPPGVRVVISSRVDPPLPLGRMRAGGRLVEIRVDDLRFTPYETAAYLDRAVDATLSPAQLASLSERTEGWAAALQLAALSMQGRDDVAAFVAEFAGDDRYIVDYLAEEVLDRQTDDVRDFLLRTSILDRLSGPLCDAVTGQRGGRASLEQLERANMFVVPLDDRRRWYRYHHLFADVLRAHLYDEDPDTTTELHGRASAWFASNGEMTEAIRHSLAAGDPERAADLVEAAIPAWRRDREESTLRTWLHQLPAEVTRMRPLLIVAKVLAPAANSGFEDDTDARLDEAERLVGLAAADPFTSEHGVIVGDRAQLDRLPATIEMCRAAYALSRGDLDGTRLHGRRALDIAPEDDHLERAAAAALVGLAAWSAGDIDAACEGYTESIAGLLRAGHASDALGCSVTLADLRLAQGRLRQAKEVYTDGLALGMSRSEGPLRGTADMHVGLSDVLREMGDLDGAREHLRHSAELGDRCGLAQYPYRSLLVTARLLAAESDIAGARALLDDAESVYTTDFSPSIRPIPAVRAGMLADHGDPNEARAWIRERELTPDDDLTYIGEFEHVTLARVLLAQFRAGQSPTSIVDAIRLLERIATEADAAGRNGDLLQVLVLLALADDARIDREAALSHLARAMTLAEPEGYVAVILEARPWIEPLLRDLAETGPSATYTRRILDTPTPLTEPRITPQPLIDPLSERELDVLRLLTSELTGPEIAGELMVSVNTMRTHTKSIYSKLGVNSRRAAVRRAEELQLLSRSGWD